MPVYSTASKARLATCHPQIQQIFNEVIKYYDVTVQEGHRTIARQAALYAQGRTKPGPIVTHVDGYRVKGKHNHTPAKAVDVTPYPGGWDAPATEYYRMAGYVLAIAGQLGVPLRWGGDWTKLKDMPHFELP